MRDYLSALAPEPFTICGVRLRPLSLGHLLLFERFEVWPICSRDDLETALLICAHPYDVALEQLARCSVRWKLRRALRKLLIRDLAPAVVQFQEYVLAHSRGPEVFDEPQNTMPGAPWLQHLKVCLGTELHYPPATVLNLPYAEALWDYYTHWENKGEAQIVSELDRQMWEIADTMPETPSPDQADSGPKTQDFGLKAKEGPCPT